MIQKTDQPTPMDAIEFGRMIGQRQTLSLFAGRCTAADADCLKKTRDRKLYRGFAKNWDECCTRHFGMSRANAERLIGLLEEFGAAYFAVAQLTRISPETFRALAPIIHGQALYHDGDPKGLPLENAERVVEAVATYRKSAPPPRTMGTRLDALEQHCNRLIQEFEKLSGAWRETGDRMNLGAVLARTRTELARLSLELGA